MKEFYIVLSGARKNQRALGQQLAFLDGLFILHGLGSELPQTPCLEGHVLLIDEKKRFNFYPLKSF